MDEFISAYFNCLQTLPTEMQRFVSSYLQSDIRYRHLIKTSVQNVSYVKNLSNMCELDSSIDTLVDDLLRMQDICDQRLYEYKELETNFESLTQELVINRAKLISNKPNDVLSETTDNTLMNSDMNSCDITHKSENERLLELSTLLRKMRPSYNSYSGQVKRLNTLKNESISKINGDETNSRSSSPPSRKWTDKNNKKRILRNDSCSRRQKLRNGFDKRNPRDRSASDNRQKYSTNTLSCFPRYTTKKFSSVNKAGLRQKNRLQHLSGVGIGASMRNRRGARSNASRIASSRHSNQLERARKQNWLSRQKSEEDVAMKKSRSDRVSHKHLSMENNGQNALSPSSKSSSSAVNDMLACENSSSMNEVDTQSDTSMPTGSDTNEDDSGADYDGNSLRENGSVRLRNSAEDTSKRLRKHGNLAETSRTFPKRHSNRQEKLRHSPVSHSLPRRLQKSKVTDDGSNHSASSVSGRSRGHMPGIRANRPKTPRTRHRTSRDGSLKLSGPGSDGNESPDEKLYCLCKKVSFGEMIACDNERCQYEWFHFACVDIKSQPKGKWFCPDCRGESKRVKRSDA